MEPIGSSGGGKLMVFNTKYRWCSRQEHQALLVFNSPQPNYYSVMHHNKQIRRQFGEHLKRLRHKYKMSQETLAERAGCTDKYIQMLEGKNPNKVSIDVLKGIADAFDIPLWKLLKF